MAEILARAHAGPWDAVVPSLFNDNPATALSWASFLMDYGSWADVALRAPPTARRPGTSPTSAMRSSSWTAGSNVC
jgi:hypothetical protein